MKLVVQRVRKARVKVVGEKNSVGEIGLGLFVLVGFGEKDTVKEVELSAEKLVKLRVMSDENDKMNLSVSDIKGEILVVSQFTLFGDTAKGNRPSFVKAAKPEKAKVLYERFVAKLREFGLKIATGEFGTHMEIEASLDGPVTIFV